MSAPYLILYPLQGSAQGLAKYPIQFLRVFEPAADVLNFCSGLVKLDDSRILD